MGKLKSRWTKSAIAKADQVAKAMFDAPAIENSRYAAHIAGNCCAQVAPTTEGILIFVPFTEGLTKSVAEKLTKKES